MNMDKLKAFKEEFTKARSAHSHSLEARYNFDSSRPLTTNREQLEKIEVDTDVNTNFHGIIDGLAAIGVVVRYNEKQIKVAKKNLKKALEEQVPEIWGADDMYEVLELTVPPLFVDNPEKN